MFAHQVIEDMGKWIIHLKKCGSQYDGKKERTNGYISLIERFLEEVSFAQHFHFGEIESLLEATNKYENEDDLPFYNIQGSEFKTPYKYIWCDYIDKTRALKYGGLVSRYGVEEGCLKSHYDLFSFVRHTARPDLLNGWHMIENVTSFQDGKRYGGYWSEDNISDKQKIASYSIVKSVACLVKRSMLLLNCKNIQTEKITAPETLNKKRRKNGKQEIFDYHVLNVVVPSNNKRGYQEKSTPLSHNRVHLCRGHFKEYTTEHPLFGKYTGLYWWQPSVRGQNKDGIVMKDYNITTNESNLERATS